MSVTFSELMREATIAEFRSDVQITHYWTNHNLELVKNYIFTSVAPRGKKSTIGLLQSFCEALTPGAPNNRFVVVANYGHGKSHFGLAAANYFGKAAGTPESDAILAAIRRAVPDDDVATSNFFDVFKQGRSPYLILLLRGDEPTGLTVKFYRALREALVHDGHLGQDERLPFWFQEAERFLQSIDSSQRDKANRFLAQFQLDLDALISEVQDGTPRAHDICVALALELYRLRPDWERGLGLQDALEWTLATYCGSDKPYAGVVIFFDEFAAFVRSYGASPTPGTPLQDLLNGVDNARGQALFVALSPIDPDEAARRSFKAESLDNVIKQLGRLPVSGRFELHSSLEEVLASYLQKRSEHWNTMLDDDQKFASSLHEATTIALQAFRQRYLDDLRWDTEHFHQVVTLSCYPLHPLTACLLCSIELEVDQDARTLLGFIRSELDRKKGQMVSSNGQPNWIWPVALVEWFGKMIGGRTGLHWQRYEQARARLTLPDEAREETLLKAMLLQAAGSISTERLHYDRTIALLSGDLDVAGVKGLLDDLANRGIIIKDRSKDTYSLPSESDLKGERMLADKEARLALDTKTLASVRDDLPDLSMGPVTVPVNWGHPEDWTIEQVLALPENLTREYLVGVTRHIRWAADGSAEKARGLIVWLIATSEDDVRTYRDRLSTLLDEAYGTDPVPVVVMRPETVDLELIKTLKRYLALKGFTTREQIEAGRDWHANREKGVADDLRDALSQYRSDCVHTVPAAFRAQIQRTRLSRLDSLMSEIIEMAYPHSPRQWFTQYKLSNRNLANAVSSLCTWLAQGKDLDSTLLTGRPVEREIVQKYLQSGWKILDSAGRVNPPSAASPTLPAWQALDGYFQPDDDYRPIRPILETLLNAPYGYDWNTLAVLFAVWYSYRRHDLAPQLPSLDKLKPREIAQRLGQVKIRRNEPGRVIEEIDRIIEEVNAGQARTRTEALREARALEEFLQRDDDDLGRRERAQSALKRLQGALQSADAYDRQARQIREDNERSAGNISALLSILNEKIPGLPVTTLVRPQEASPAELRSLVCEHISRTVARLCEQYRNLRDLTEYQHNRRQLEIIKRHLEQAGLSSDAGRVAEALVTLEDAKARIEYEQRLKAQRAEINAIATKGPLSTLEKSLRVLEAIKPLPDLEPDWARKIDVVRAELESLIRFAHSLDQRLDQVIEIRALQHLRDEILSRRLLYDDDENQSLIERALQRCSDLIRFCEAANNIQRHDRKSVDDFDADVRQARELLEIKGERLGPAHRAVVEKLMAEMEAERQRRQQETCARLATLEQDLEKGVDAVEVKESLDKTAWDFLPEDQRPRLGRLHRRIEDRIEQDEVARVIHHFRNIRDPQRRRECLEKLQQLVREVA